MYLADPAVFGIIVTFCSLDIYLCKWNLEGESVTWLKGFIPLDNIKLCSAPSAGKSECGWYIQGSVTSKGPSLLAHSWW